MATIVGAVRYELDERGELKIVVGAIEFHHDHKLRSALAAIADVTSRFRAAPGRLTSPRL
jgi:hypothetical protein